MNWKMFVASHWKAILLTLQLCLFLLMVTTVNPLGDPIDSPVGPK